MGISWVQRDEPLDVHAAWYPDARPLLRGWALDPRRATWRGLLHGSGVLLHGPDLPWADGTLWLGVDAEAPSLWMPTRLRPSAPIDWVEVALVRRFAKVNPPFALLGDGRVLAASGCTVLDPLVLQAVADRP